jgi:solute:Na+ symporter, SSS family
MNAAVSVGVLAVFMVGTVALGLLSVRRRQRSLLEWSVGGRSMGLLLTWVLMAGETYTSYSYLGAAGWSYTHGVSGLYLVAYLSIGMGVTYVTGPLLWSYAHRHGLHSISDLAAHRFNSPLAGAVVAVLATVFILPYVQLQITGMGVVVATISYGTISLGVAYLLAFLISEAFILVSGLRGSAWVSALKDSMVVLTMLVVFVWVPLHYFGGYGELLQRMLDTHRSWLTLPGPATSGPVLGIGWFVSTAALNAVVYSIFPTTVAGFLGARSPRVLRGNAVYLPFYQLLLFIPVLLGFASVLVVPGLKDSNLALFTLVTETLPAWLLGVVGAAAALSSIVPMAVFMLVIGTMWTRSILSRTQHGEQTQRHLAQLVTLLAGAVSLAMTYLFPNALVRLSVLSYEGIAQLLPMVLLSLVWRRLSLPAGLAGLAVGVLVDVGLVYGGADPLYGVNAGVLALAANLAVAAVVSRVRPADTPRARLAVAEPHPAG